MIYIYIYYHYHHFIIVVFIIIIIIIITFKKQRHSSTVMKLTKNSSRMKYFALTTSSSSPGSGWAVKINAIFRNKQFTNPGHTLDRIKLAKVLCDERLDLTEKWILFQLFLLCTLIVIAVCVCLCASVCVCSLYKDYILTKTSFSTSRRCV